MPSACIASEYTAESRSIRDRLIVAFLLAANIAPFDPQAHRVIGWAGQVGPSAFRIAWRELGCTAIFLS